jgi:hypothetical protein
VIYAELTGAEHAFDLFCSPRTAHMLDAVLKFLDATHAAASPAETPETLADGGVGHLASPFARTKMPGTTPPRASSEAAHCWQKTQTSAGLPSRKSGMQPAYSQLGL